MLCGYVQKAATQTGTTPRVAYKHKGREILPLVFPYRSATNLCGKSHCLVEKGQRRSLREWMLRIWSVSPV